ncbi:MAG: hypothetical protein AAF902_13985, partial [Chloroflexota bacterium]
MLKKNSRLFLMLLMLMAFLAACGGEDLAGTIEEAAETVGEVADEVAENADEVAETVEEVIEVDAAAPFAGETIEIIIPYGEGGGSDTWMRAIAPFLQKYLGDDVTVQPINMPGASGTLGANDFAARDADGLSLLVSSGSNALPYILGEDAVQYDFADFAGVMGSPVGGVVYVSADSGITDVAGLCEASDLIYGGISPTGLDLVPLMAFDLMGIDYLPILGYDGRGAARVAFEQGEINLDYQTSPAFLKNVQPLVDEGSAVPLFAFGILDSSGNITTDPVFSDLPNVKEAIETCGGSTSGPEFEGFKAAFTAGFAAQKNLWVAGDAPQERIDALTAAAQETIADAEFQALAADLLGGYEFYAGAGDVDTAFGAANNMSADAFNSLKSFLDRVFDVAITKEAEEMEDDAMMAEVTGAYAGETIEIVVPYGEGGGSDTWTRALAPFLQKYLGDDVTVQVINMPGASGTLGANDYAAREADGLTLLNSSGSNALPYILGQEAVQYDFADFTGVMGSPVGGVVYVSPDTGITSVEDLCNSSEPLIYGGISATGLDMVALRAFDLMGVDFVPILGYDGRGAARVAFEQGEINLDYQTSSGFIKNVTPLVEEGSAVPLFAFGILDSAGNIATDPVFSDLPNAEEAIAACGGPTSGADFEGFKAAFTAGFAAQKNLWVHGGAPADKIA